MTDWRSDYRCWFTFREAMAAGIDAASGELIATIDGDLQNDPTDIPLMIEKLET